MVKRIAPAIIAISRGFSVAFRWPDREKKILDLDETGASG